MDETGIRCRGASKLQRGLAGAAEDAEDAGAARRCVQAALGGTPQHEHARDAAMAKAQGDAAMAKAQGDAAMAKPQGDAAMAKPGPSIST